MARETREGNGAQYAMYQRLSNTSSSSSSGGGVAEGLLSTSTN